MLNLYGDLVSGTKIPTNVWGQALSCIHEMRKICLLLVASPISEFVPLKSIIKLLNLQWDLKRSQTALSLKVSRPMRGWLIQKKYQGTRKKAWCYGKQTAQQIPGGTEGRGGQRISSCANHLLHCSQLDRLTTQLHTGQCDLLSDSLRRGSGGRNVINLWRKALFWLRTPLAMLLSRRKRSCCRILF